MSKNKQTVFMLAVFLGLIAFWVMVFVAIAKADTRVVGDSLSRQTYFENTEWIVNAKNGRPLGGNVDLVKRTASFNPNALVVALGSNDVARSYGVAPVAKVASISLPCVVITTVKVNGVTPFYNKRWKQYARLWNRAVFQSGAVVAHWNKHQRGHPEWFLADGLHLSEAGKTAYDQFLRTTVATQCPGGDI